MWLYRHKWCLMLRSPKFGSCPGKHQKTPEINFGWLQIEVAWYRRGVEGRVFTILQWESCVQSGCRVGSVDQKQQDVDNSERCLQLFPRNKKEFLHKYMTMDETWIHHFTLDSNQQSNEWTAAVESHPKRSKTQTSAGKVLASVFWDAQGILFINYLEKGRTIYSEYYIALLVCLKEEIAKKLPQLKKKVLFH